MPGRAFVDTSVLVYAVDDADPVKRDRAREMLAGRAGQLVLSAQVLSEFHVVATRKLAAPLSERDAAEAIRLWGAQIGAAAAVAGCDRVLTEDLPDGAELSSVRVENPFR